MKNLPRKRQREDVKVEDARKPAGDNSKWILLAVTIAVLFSVKYYCFIQDHSLENNEGDDKAFIVYGDRIIHGGLNETDKKVVYNHIHKPLMMLIPALLIKLGLIKQYLLLPFAFDMLLFTAVFMAIEDKTRNTLLALGGGVLASWNTLLGYYSFQFLPEMPFAASIIAFTLCLDRMLKTQKRFYAYACGIFFSLTILFRLDAGIVLLAATSAYALKALLKDRSKKDFRNIALATALGIGIVAVYFVAYVSVIEGQNFGLEDLTGLGGRLMEAGRAVLIEDATESMGVVMFLPHMLLLASTPLVLFFALMGALHTYRREGLLETYLFTFLLLLAQRWIVFYIGRGAQKYLTCFMPFLSVFAVVEAWWAAELIGSHLKSGRAFKSCLTGIIVLLMIYSAYFWIHEPIPGRNVQGYNTAAILLEHPLRYCYEWDQQFGKSTGYLLFRDGLREYEAERRMEPDVVYTNMDKEPWMSLIVILEGVAVKNIGEYREGMDGIIAVGTDINGYAPQTAFSKNDSRARKLVIMTPREYSQVVYTTAVKEQPAGDTTNAPDGKIQSG